MARSVKSTKGSSQRNSRKSTRNKTGRTTAKASLSARSRISGKSKQEQVQTVEVVIDNSVLKLAAILILGIVAVVALLVYGQANSGVTTPNNETAQQAQQKNDATELPSVIGESPVLGKTNAPVTIFEYGDFECPFCRRHELQTFPQIKKEYIDTGKVKYVAKNLIVVPGHKPSAEPTAYAAYCVYKVGGNGAFWKFKSAIVHAFDKGENGVPASATVRLSNKKKLLAGLRNVAKEVGVDLTKYDVCMKNTKDARAFIAKDQAYVESKIIPLMPNGVGTPMFVICKTPKDNNTECKGPVIMGAYPFSKFKQTIDSLLNK